MNVFLTVVLVLLVALAVWFYDAFTKKGAVPLAAAWKSFTVWLSAAGMVLGAYIVDLLQWAASYWEPLRAQFGDVLSAPSAGAALQILSAIFFVLRMKGQGLPAFPHIPEPDDEF